MHRSYWRKCHVKLSIIFYWMLWSMLKLHHQFENSQISWYVTSHEYNGWSVILWHWISLKWKNLVKWYYFLHPQLEMNIWKLILYSATFNSHWHTYKMYFVFFISLLRETLFSTKASHEILLFCLWTIFYTNGYFNIGILYPIKKYSNKGAWKGVKSHVCIWHTQITLPGSDENQTIVWFSNYE